MTSLACFIIGLLADLRRQRFRVDEGVMLHGLMHLDERVDGGFAVAAGFNLGRRQLQLVVALAVFFGIGSPRMA